MAFSLSLTVPTTFIETPTSQNVTEGEALIIRCRASGIPDPVLTWFIDGEALPPDDGRLFGDTLLVISETGIDDSGVYICHASNDLATVQHSIIITVLPMTGRILVALCIHAHIIIFPQYIAFMYGRDHL